MSLPALIGALAAFFLVHVLAGVPPVNYSLDIQLAIWLFAVLAAVATYAYFERLVSSAAVG